MLRLWATATDRLHIADLCPLTSATAKQSTCRLGSYGTASLELSQVIQTEAGHAGNCTRQDRSVRTIIYAQSFFLTSSPE